MTRRRVAIIGAGFSGVALAAQLARRPNAPAIELIERARFGVGLAYSTTDVAHLLNVRASRMSAYADRPDHFIRWLRSNTAILGEDPFAPRATYRRYMDAVLKRAQSARMFGGVRRHHHEAVACRRSDAGWRVGLASGEEVISDDVVLALGHSPARAPEALVRAGIAVIDAWDCDALMRIPPKADVLIMGTGLSMVDVALSLTKQRRTGVIYALSRRGLTPRAQAAQSPHAPYEALILPARLSEALHAFRAEIGRMAARGEPWQLAFDRIRADTPALWRRLSPDAQSRFLRHLRPWWDVHRHRAAPEVSARIAALTARGALRVFAGELVSATPTKDGAQVFYRQRGGLARHRIEVAHVINCTGADNRLARNDDALTRQLLADGIARPHPSTLGFDVDEQGRLINASGDAQQGLYALGPIVQGAFWETTAVPEIRTRAAALADLLCVR